MASLPVPSGGDDPVREARLHDVIAAYLEALEAGSPPDRGELLRREPELAAELADFFANRDHLARFASPGIIRFPSAKEPPSDAVPGDRIAYFGDYELLDVIAQGGMGVVYRARQVSLNRILALKMVRAGRLATPDDLFRFRLEAEAAAHLDHPHIVPIYEVGEHEGHHYFSMKLIDGGNLATQASRFRADPRASARLVATVARAVHYAHRRGILHRDLKPANILLSGAKDDPPDRLIPHVTDFGLAKRVETGDAGVTSSGSIVGTPCYMAPEQAEGRREAITTAVDVHALGAILYELLVGVPPFRSDSVLETLRQVREQEPTRPRSINRRIPRDLETIVLKCLEKSPLARYPSAEALADDLDRWLAGLPIQARPASGFERVAKWARRRPTAAALLVVAGVAVMSTALAVRGLISAARLQSEVDRAGLALESESTQGPAGRGRARHDGERLLLQAVDRRRTGVGAERPGPGRPPARSLPGRAPRLGVAPPAAAVPFRAPDPPGTQRVPLRRLVQAGRDRGCLRRGAEGIRALGIPVAFGPGEAADPRPRRHGLWPGLRPGGDADGQRRGRAAWSRSGT